MQLIPAQLVPVVQGYLQQQGLDPGLIDSGGSLSAAGVANVFFDTATVRTAVTPDLIFPINAHGQPASPAMQQLMSTIQPTVTLSGRFGTVTVAPYGTAQGAGSWWPLALGGAAAVLFLGWAVFGK